MNKKIIKQIMALSLVFLLGLTCYMNSPNLYAAAEPAREAPNGTTGETQVATATDAGKINNETTNNETKTTSKTDLEDAKMKETAREALATTTDAVKMGKATLSVINGREFKKEAITASNVSVSKAGSYSILVMAEGDFSVGNEGVIFSNPLPAKTNLTMYDLSTGHFYYYNLASSLTSVEFQNFKRMGGNTKYHPDRKDSYELIISVDYSGNGEGKGCEVSFMGEAEGAAINVNVQGAIKTKQKANKDMSMETEKEENLLKSENNSQYYMLADISNSSSSMNYVVNRGDNISFKVNSSLSYDVFRYSKNNGSFTNPVQQNNRRLSIYTSVLQYKAPSKAGTYQYVFVGYSNCYSLVTDYVTIIVK